METEIWKYIQWYEWVYSVSNLWNVRSIRKILKPQKRWNRKYYAVDLCKDGNIKSFRVSRLVMSAFHWVDLLDVKILACHIDDNIYNNRSDNIFAWSSLDNSRDMVNKNRQWWFKNSGNNNGQSKFSDEIYIKAIELYKSWSSLVSISKLLWPSESSIRWVINWSRRRYLFNLVSLW